VSKVNKAGRINSKPPVSNSAVRNPRKRGGIAIDPDDLDNPMTLANQDDDDDTHIGGKRASKNQLVSMDHI